MSNTTAIKMITVDATTVDAAEYFKATRVAITDTNVMVQNSAYLAAYHLTKHFNLTLVQQMFNRLTVVDGTVNVTLFENLQAWFGVYFDSAKTDGCIKGYPISIKREMDNATGDESVSVTWVLDDNGNKKNPLPDSKVQLLADKMMSVLEDHANAFAVTTAAKNRKHKSKAAQEKAQAEKLEKMSDVEKKAAEEKEKRDNRDRAMKSIDRAVTKAAEKLVANGGTSAEIYAELMRLAEQFKPVETAPVTEETTETAE